MSTSIYKEISYTPYGYHIMHKPTGRMYVGSRTKKGCHPDELWNPNYKGGGYFTSSKIVKKIIKEEGIDSFEVLHVYTGETKEEVLAKEQEILMLFGAAQSVLMLNRHNGGKNFSRAGVSPTEEVRRKLSESGKGRPVSEEVRRKLSESGKGRIVSEETRKKLSEVNTGKTHTAVSRKKMSEFRVGTKLSEETRSKMSAKHAGELNANAKPHIITPPNGEEILVKSLSPFCRDNNLLQGNMTKVAKGKRNHHKGFKCRYATPEEISAYENNS